MTHKIMIVGEAWGEEEAKQQTPFVGTSGYQLRQLLNDAEIDLLDCYLTNVFNLRPEKNDIETLCDTKDRGIQGLEALRPGKYVRAEYASELARLFNEIQTVKPNLIVAMGATAAWAILGSARIRKVRGTISDGPYGIKTIATYHPAAILRQFELRPVTIYDLMKAKRQMDFPEIRRPNRQIWIEPGLNHLTLFYNTYLKNAKEISMDIETVKNFITCIGFAPNKSVALVVPFVALGRPGNVYWSSFEEEKVAWQFVKRICEGPAKKIMQNGLYDANFLWRRYGIKSLNWEDDTMLLHHAMQPESPKGLDFLGSVYTDEAAWKLMRTKVSTIKKDA